MKDIQLKIHKYLQDRKWDTVAPGDFAKSISIEAAELLEIFQWGSPSSEEAIADTHKMQEIKSELADVMIYCLDLSDILKLDAKQLILDKLAHNEKKYPAHLMKGSEFQKVYMRIKREYREKR